MSQETNSEKSYDYKFKKQALKNFQALDKSIREQLYKKLDERCDNPRVPSAALRGNMAGLYKIKIKGIRLIYQVIDNELVILVLIVDKRENDDVYS